MVDRLEELLALLEDEDEEEKGKDALELGTAAPAAPAPEIETGGVPGDGVEKAGAPLVEDVEPPAEAEGLSWTPDVRTIPVDGQDEAPGASGAAASGGSGDEAAENRAAELLWDGLAVLVTGRNGTAPLRTPGAGDVEIQPPAGAERQRGAGEVDAVMASMRPTEQGLEGLYRQTVQASRPAAQSLPVEQAGRTALAREPGRTAALTVDELDRAVRRDSRRYDGGMALF